MPSADHGKIQSYLALAAVWVSIVAVGVGIMTTTTVDHWRYAGFVIVSTFSGLTLLSLIAAAFAWRRQNTPADSQPPAPEAPLGYWDFKADLPKVVHRIGALATGIAADFNKFAEREPYHRARIVAAGTNPFQKRRRLADQARDIAGMADGMNKKVRQLEQDARYAAEGYVVLAEWEQPATREEINEAVANVKGASEFLAAVRVSVTAISEVKKAALGLRRPRGNESGVSQHMNAAVDQNIVMLDRTIEALKLLDPALDRAIQTWRRKIGGTTA